MHRGRRGERAAQFFHLFAVMFAGQPLPMGSTTVKRCQWRSTKRGARTGPLVFSVRGPTDKFRVTRLPCCPHHVAAGRVTASAYSLSSAQGHVVDQADGRKAGEWQTYDITLVGRLLTVVLNGHTIISLQIIPGPSWWSARQQRRPAWADLFTGRPRPDRVPQHRAGAVNQVVMRAPPRSLAGACMLAG